MSQNAKLLSYLSLHGSITTHEAFDALGICRLSERVRELERLRWVFAHTRTQVPTRHGHAYVTRYSVIREPESVAA